DEAEFEVAEAVEYGGEGEVERAEAEDGEDVGCEDDEGVAGDGKDGGDRVDGEEDVAAFHDEQGEEERGDGGAAVDSGEEALAFERGAERGEPADEADEGVAGGAQFVRE